MYSNLRADNDEWHSPAPRLDACLRAVGADLQNVFFGHGHGITVKSVAHFTHFSDLIVKLQRCAKRQLNHGRKDCVQCTSGAAEFWWNLVESLLESGAVEVECQRHLALRSFFVEYCACFLKCGVRTETMTFGMSAGFHTGRDLSQVSERTSINLTTPPTHLTTF